MLISSFWWMIAAIGPTALLVVFVLRANKLQTSDAWADYGDVSIVLEWFTAPAIVVFTPILAHEAGWSAVSAGFSSVCAIVLFYFAFSALFYESGSSISQRVYIIILGFGKGIGLASLIAYLVFNDELTSIYPSFMLYLNILLCSLVGNRIANWLGYFVDGKLNPKTTHEKELGAGELLDRINEIAAKQNVKIEKVSLGSDILGNFQTIAACACDEGELFINEKLISKFTKAEVDAVIEHEIGHFTENRAVSFGKASVNGAIIVLVALAVGSIDFIKHSNEYFLIYPIWLSVYIFSELISRCELRSAEQKANENVGYMTSPLAEVSLHHKLMLMNNIPFSRPWWSKILSSHPSVEEQINAIISKYSLSDDLVKEACKKAEIELNTNEYDYYELPVVEQTEQVPEDVEEQVCSELVPRTGGWYGVFAGFLSLVVFCVFFYMNIWFVNNYYTIETLIGPYILLHAVLAIGGCTAIIVVPIVMSSRARLCIIRERIQTKLKSVYGEDLVLQSLLLDVVLPSSDDKEQFWQGALLYLQNGELIILGEIEELHIPLDTDISFERLVDMNSSGHDAKMMMLHYYFGGEIQILTLRPLWPSVNGSPSDLKQLEKYLKKELKSSCAKIIPFKDFETRLSNNEYYFNAKQQGVLPKKKWYSIRVLIAAIIFSVVLISADMIAQISFGPGYKMRIVFWIVAFMFSGLNLWFWAFDSKDFEC